MASGRAEAAAAAPRVAELEEELRSLAEQLSRCQVPERGAVPSGRGSEGPPGAARLGSGGHVPLSGRPLLPTGRKLRVPRGPAGSRPASDGRGGPGGRQGPGRPARVEQKGRVATAAVPGRARGGIGRSVHRAFGGRPMAPEGGGGCVCGAHLLGGGGGGDGGGPRARHGGPAAAVEAGAPCGPAFSAARWVKPVPGSYCGLKASTWPKKRIFFLPPLPGPCRPKPPFICLMCNVKSIEVLPCATPGKMNKWRDFIDM